MTTNRNINELFCEACACMEQGLCYDEINDTENALAFYSRSLLLIKEAEKEKSCKKSDMYKVVMAGKNRVDARVKDLKSNKKRQEQVEDETWDMKKMEMENEENKKELKKQIESMHTVEADLMYYIPDGVQLFIIENESTSTPTFPSSLEIFRFPSNQEKAEKNQVEAFIQVGPWSYPLVRGKTPVLQNDFGAYIVPNPTPEHPDMFVGILLPEDLDNKDKEDFYSILKHHTEIRTQELSLQMSKEEREHLSRKIGDFLMRGGDYLATNINHVAEKTSKIVSDKSARIRSSLAPDQEPMKINPSIRFGVHYVHKGSKMVAKCTKYLHKFVLVDKIGDMGISVGKTLAFGAEKHLGDKESGVVHGTVYVLGSGIISASTVWIALENASKTMAKNIADETVDTVKHKWGNQASVTAHEALYATGHTSLAALQLWDLGPRSIAGRAARKAGTQFVTDLYKKKSTSHSEDIKKEN
uniref:Inheritance of peroxisomes protein 1 n=1 Tax=Elaeophora elaphi TaxID=1147741 RepID=A0A158Q6U4_9BILA